MDVDSIITRVAGAFRNAVVWGGAWFTLATPVGAAIRLGEGVSAPIALADGIFIGVRVGFIGAIAGAVFAGLISVIHRGRRLSELSWLRFGAGGAIMAGLFVPAVLLAGNLIAGDGSPALAHILDDGVYAAVFGGITAAGSLKLAQRAEALPSSESHGQLARPQSPGDPVARAKAAYATARSVEK